MAKKLTPDQLARLKRSWKEAESRGDKKEAARILGVYKGEASRKGPSGGATQSGPPPGKRTAADQEVIDKYASKSPAQRFAEGETTKEEYAKERKASTAKFAKALERESEAVKGRAASRAEIDTSRAKSENHADAVRDIISRQYAGDIDDDEATAELKAVGKKFGYEKADHDARIASVEREFEDEPSKQTPAQKYRAEMDEERIKKEGIDARYEQMTKEATGGVDDARFERNAKAIAKEQGLTEEQTSELTRRMKEYHGQRVDEDGADPEEAMNDAIDFARDEAFQRSLENEEEDPETKEILDAEDDARVERASAEERELLGEDDDGDEDDDPEDEAEYEAEVEHYEKHAPEEVKAKSEAYHAYGAKGELVPDTFERDYEQMQKASTRDDRGYQPRDAAEARELHNEVSDVVRRANSGELDKEGYEEERQRISDQFGADDEEFDDFENYAREGGPKKSTDEGPGADDGRYEEYVDRARNSLGIGDADVPEAVRQRALELADKDGTVLRDEHLDRVIVEEVGQYDDYDPEQDKIETEERKDRKLTERITATGVPHSTAYLGLPRESKLKAFAKEETAGERVKMDPKIAAKIAKEGGIKSVETGPRGGIYYVTQSGKKVYTKKG